MWQLVTEEAAFHPLDRPGHMALNGRVLPSHSLKDSLLWWQRFSFLNHQTSASIRLSDCQTYYSLPVPDPSRKDSFLSVFRCALSSDFCHLYPISASSSSQSASITALRCTWGRSGTTSTFSNKEANSPPSSYPTFVSSGTTILPELPHYPKPLFSHLILWLVLFRFCYKCFSLPGAHGSHATLILCTSNPSPLIPWIFLSCLFHHSGFDKWEAAW